MCYIVDNDCTYDYGYNDDDSDNDNNNNLLKYLLLEAVTNSGSDQIQFYDHIHMGPACSYFLDYKLIFLKYNIISAEFVVLEAYAVGN